MVQSDPANPIVEVPEIPDHTAFWESLKGMGFEDAVNTIANSLVRFSLRLVLAILIFYLGRFLIRKIYKIVNGIMTRREMDPSLTTFVLSLIKITLYFVLIIIVIGILGVETSSFIAIFASAGVAIGMALSGTLQNFAGGVLILLLKPYKVGDVIETQGFVGRVKSIQLFNTIINTTDNKAIILPNGGLSTSSINNYSLEGYRRVDLTVGLTYGTDIEAAKKAMCEIALKNPLIVRDNDPEWPDRAPFAGLLEMADSSIVFTVRVWAPADEYWPVFFSLNELLYSELQKRGFSFPFPQLDVHLIPES